MRSCCCVMDQNGESRGAETKAQRTRSGTERLNGMAGKRPSKDDLRHLTAGDHGNPHAILGAHAATVGKQTGVAIRALMPNAVRCECIFDGSATLEMELLAEGKAN